MMGAGARWGSHCCMWVLIDDVTSGSGPPAPLYGRPSVLVGTGGGPHLIECADQEANRAEKSVLARYRPILD
eukprot:scaffold374_cov133-Skeletonema_menzelii.AAC.15